MDLEAKKSEIVDTLRLSSRLWERWIEMAQRLNKDGCGQPGLRNFLFEFVNVNRSKSYNTSTSMYMVENVHTYYETFQDLITFLVGTSTVADGGGALPSTEDELVGLVEGCFHPTQFAVDSIWNFLLCKLWKASSSNKKQPKNQHPVNSLKPETLSHPISHLLYINRLFLLERLWNLHMTCSLSPDELGAVRVK